MVLPPQPTPPGGGAGNPGFLFEQLRHYIQEICDLRLKVLERQVKEKLDQLDKRLEKIEKQINSRG